MALINCPECRKEVSDLARTCIHCGFPLIEDKNEICIIDGREHNLVSIKQRILSTDPDDKLLKNSIIDDLYHMVGTISIYAAAELYYKILQTKEIPETYDGSHLTHKSKPICCPKCRSTQITTGARGYSLLTGFLGAGQTVNRCAKCGHTWKPRG